MAKRNPFKHGFSVSPEQRRRDVSDARMRLAQLDAVALAWPTGYVVAEHSTHRTAVELLLCDSAACERAGIDANEIARAGIAEGMIEDPDNIHHAIDVSADIVASVWTWRSVPENDAIADKINARFGDVIPHNAETARKMRADAKRRLCTALKALGEAQ